MSDFLYELQLLAQFMKGKESIIISFELLEVKDDLHILIFGRVEVRFVIQFDN